MEITIPAWSYGQLWQRYERLCKAKELDPFSDLALAMWALEVSIPIGDDIVLPLEVEIIGDILSAAKRTG